MSELDPRVVEILEEAQRLGIIGKAPLATHIDQAKAFFAIVEDLVVSDADVLDLGSGGGLPGLVIASCWPSLHVSLLDGRSSRTANLLAAVELLGWSPRVRVIGRRAEDAARDPNLRASYDLVVSRGFGPPSVTAECGAPFLKPRGLLVVSDPPGGGSDDRWSIVGCSMLGLVVERSQVDPWALSVLRQVSPCDDRYPRRTGLPLKRPLF